MLESLHLFLEGPVVTTGSLLLTSGLLLLPGVLLLLLLLALAGRSVIVPRCLAAAFGWLLLGGLRILLLLLLHVLAIWALLARSALASAMLGRTGGLIVMVLARLSVGLGLLSALLLSLDLLLGGQVLLILGVLPAIVLSALHWSLVGGLIYDLNDWFLNQLLTVV